VRPTHITYYKRINTRVNASSYCMCVWLTHMNRTPSLLQRVPHPTTSSISKSDIENKSPIKSIKSLHKVQFKDISRPIVLTTCQNDLLGSDYSIKYWSIMNKSNCKGSISASIFLLSSQERTLEIILKVSLIKLISRKSPTFLLPAILGTKAIKPRLSRERLIFLSMMKYRILKPSGSGAVKRTKKRQLPGSPLPKMAPQDPDTLALNWHQSICTLKSFDVTVEKSNQTHD